MEIENSSAAEIAESIRSVIVDRIEREYDPKLVVGVLILETIKLIMAIHGDNIERSGGTLSRLVFDIWNGYVDGFTGGPESEKMKNRN